MRRTSTMSVLGLYNYDNTLFDDMIIPTTLTKQVLVDNLLMELAELEVVYTSAPFMKLAIKQWSTKMIDNWNKEQSALSNNYDPLHNYDRTETVEETGNTSGTSGNTNKVTGYNSSTMQDATSNASTSDVDSTIERNIRAYGNIGVTTSQQMLESELKLRSNYNIYDLIINDFKNRFCVLVY